MRKKDESMSLLAKNLMQKYRALTTAPNVAALVSPTTVVHGHPRSHWSSIKRLKVQTVVISMDAPSEDRHRRPIDYMGADL
jgi:hypothetical protein